MEDHKGMKLIGIKYDLRRQFNGFAGIVHYCSDRRSPCQSTKAPETSDYL
ncbi:MAG: hypothetical protein ACFKPT_02600 [Gloeotrichia echinulata GP01]